MKMNLERIDEELKKKGWSRYRLAQELRINPNTLYSTLEKGSFKSVAAIARALEVKETELVIDG